jgi:hypothetical protein
MPGTLNLANDIFAWDIFHSGYGVLVWIIPEHDTVQFVLVLSEPAFFQIVQDDLDLGFFARNETHIGHRDRQSTSQYPTEMSGRMSQLVLLIVSILEVNEDTQIVSSRRDADACTCEFGAQLIEASRSNSLFGAIHPECRYWWMVGCLLGDIGYLDWPVIRGRIVDNRRLSPLAENRGQCILDFPVALFCISGLVWLQPGQGLP